MAVWYQILHHMRKILKEFPKNSIIFQTSPLVGKENHKLDLFIILIVSPRHKCN